MAMSTIGGFSGYIANTLIQNQEESELEVVLESVLKEHSCIIRNSTPQNLQSLLYLYTN